MKKVKFQKLALKKSTVSNLSQVKGGGITLTITNGNPCGDRSIEGCSREITCVPSKVCETDQISCECTDGCNSIGCPDTVTKAQPCI